MVPYALRSKVRQFDLILSDIMTKVEVAIIQ